MHRHTYKRSNTGGSGQVQMTSRGTHDRWRNRLILPVPLHYDTAVMKAIAVQTSADTHTTENKNK